MNTYEHPTRAIKCDYCDAHFDITSPAAVGWQTYFLQHADGTKTYLEVRCHLCTAKKEQRRKVTVSA